MFLPSFPLNHPTVYKRLPLALLIAQLAACGGSSSGSTTTDDIGTDDANAAGNSSTVFEGTLVINEIVAKDAAGGNDWIELYVTEGSVNLSAYTLVDNDPTHTPEPLPDIVLNAGEYFVIEATDETADDGAYRVTFKLGSEDSLTLALSGTTIDQLSWQDGDASEGYSYGRLPDGTGATATLTPTRGAANTASDSNEALTDTIVASFPTLRINEVVAKTTDNSPDWIEFYVSGDASVYLGDYSVKDEDSTQAYALPAVTLSPGEYYVVYATEDALDGGNTVPFKLGASDGVKLYQGTDLMDQLEWSKGQALAGFSYGRYQGVRTLTPTPNVENSPAQRGPLVINEVVTKAEDDGPDWFELYNNSATPLDLSTYTVVDDDTDSTVTTLPAVTLAPGGYLRIYATTEVLGEGVYSVPFKLGSSDSLSLMLLGETADYLAWEDSDAPQGYSYGAYPDGSWTLRTLEVTPETANQDAVVFDNTQVESLYITLDAADWQDMLTNATAEENHPASVTYKGVTLDNIAIRTKGNSSLTSVANSGGTRFSFKLDTNEYVDGQRLLNRKKLNLNNQFKDPTYIREHLSYALLREMDVPAPSTSFVNLYINGELHGLYGLVEQVDDAFLANHYSDASGDLYKPDATGIINGQGHTLAWFGDEFSSYTAVELKTNEDSSDNLAFLHFVDVLNHQGEDTNALTQVVDVDAVLRYLAVSTVMGNLDSYQGSLAHNYYLYENNQVFSVIPWDMNQSFGSFAMGCTSEEVLNLYLDEPTSGALADRPLIAQLLQHDFYREQYHEYIQLLIDYGLEAASFAQQADNITQLIRDAVYNDPTAFYSPSEFEAGLTQAIGDVPGLLSFAEERVNRIQQQLNGTLPASGDGSGSCSGTGQLPPGGGFGPGTGQPPGNGQPPGFGPGGNG